MNTSKEQSIPLKEILRAAIIELDTGGYDEYYMCSAIRKASSLFDCDGSQVIKKATEIGFTRENYHKFVQEHFPYLQVYLNKHYSYWLSVMAALCDGLLKEVIKSKKEFLQSLVDKL